MRAEEIAKSFSQIWNLLSKEGKVFIMLPPKFSFNPLFLENLSQSGFGVNIKTLQAKLENQSSVFDTNLLVVNKSKNAFSTIDKWYPVISDFAINRLLT